MRHEVDEIKFQGKHSRAVAPSKYHWTGYTQVTGLAFAGVGSSPEVWDLWPRPCSQVSSHDLKSF